MTSPLTQAEEQQDVLIEVLQAELEVQAQLAAQRGAMQSLSEGMAQLLSYCGSPECTTPMQTFHSLHELLMEDARQQEEGEKTADKTYATVGGQVLLRRLLDIHGLPPAHKLLGGSLQPPSLHELLPHVAHWTSRLSAALPQYTLSHCSTSRKACVRTSESTAASNDTLVSNNREEEAQAQAQSVTMQRFYLVATALWRLLDYFAYILRISTQREGENDDDGDNAMQAVGFRNVLTAQRPTLRFVVAELSSVRDVLVEEVAYRRAHQLLWPTRSSSSSTTTTMFRDDATVSRRPIDLSFASPVTLLQRCVLHGEGSTEGDDGEEMNGLQCEYDPANPCELPRTSTCTGVQSPAMRLLHSITSSPGSAMWMSVAETMQLAEYADELCRRLGGCIASEG